MTFSMLLNKKRILLYGIPAIILVTSTAYILFPPSTETLLCYRRRSPRRSRASGNLVKYDMSIMWVTIGTNSDRPRFSNAWWCLEICLLLQTRGHILDSGLPRILFCRVVWTIWCTFEIDKHRCHRSRHCLRCCPSSIGYQRQSPSENILGLDKTIPSFSILLNKQSKNQSNVCMNVLRKTIIDLKSLNLEFEAVLACYSRCIVISRCNLFSITRVINASHGSHEILEG